MRWMTLLVLCVGSSHLQAQFAAERNTQGGSRAGNDPVAAMVRDLQEARELVKKMPASANRDRIELLLTRTELQLKQQTASMAGGKSQSMPSTEFNRFQTAFRKIAFDKDKYQFLENNLRGQFVNCEQAAQLVKDFSFDTDRIRAAVLLHGHLSDPEAFYRVLDTFSFDSSKKQVTDRIRGGK
jgi:hypothetical protein